MTMSEQAKSALINARGTHVGASVDGAKGKVWGEMYADGLIGTGGKLTRKGSVEAMKAKRAAEDEAFGL